MWFRWRRQPRFPIRSRIFFAPARGGIGQNLDYEFAGIGDFNGDGRDDVLLRHRDVCSWVYYEMHPTERGTHRRPGITRNPLFTLHAVADITGDGRDDVMLRNTKSREWIYYAMTGPRALLQRPPGMTRTPRWTLHAIGDFDGSGRATPLIRLSVSGGWALYDIQGLDAQVVHFPGMSREQTWTAVGTLPAFHDGNPAQFSMIEFLQGPPTFRRDFRTGEVIGPVKASRPENDEEPVAEWQRIVGLTGQQAWSAANRGFVTSVWGRETVVAVEATHSYRAPAPQVEVELITAEGAIVALDVLLDITEPNVTGYRTELVFDLPRERNVPGTAVIARLHTEGATIEERQELFGETVEPVRVTWIPISTEDFAAPELDPEEYFATIRAAWPIAAYETRLGPEMRYEPTGNEEPDTVFDGVGEGGLYDQVILHHATHGCGDAEDYYGIYPNNAMGDARVETGGIAIGGFVMVGGDFPHEIHGIEPHELFEYPPRGGTPVGTQPHGLRRGPGPQPPLPQLRQQAGGLGAQSPEPE